MGGEEEEEEKEKEEEEEGRDSDGQAQRKRSCLSEEDSQAKTLPKDWVSRAAANLDPSVARLLRFRVPYQRIGALSAIRALHSAESNGGGKKKQQKEETIVRRERESTRVPELDPALVARLRNRQSHDRSTCAQRLCGSLTPTANPAEMQQQATPPHPLKDGGGEGEKEKEKDKEK